MATREEQHTTRGRANVLRLAMNGKLGEAGLGDEAVKETLSLCLECRACKSECPVGVDVASFKSEFLAGYYERHGVPLKARVLGNAGTMARWGGAMTPLANAMLASAPVRWLNERLAGIDRRRTLPRFVSTTLQERWRGAAGAEARLFIDTFTNHYHPEIGLAAVEVLAAAGVALAPAPNVCCGRTMISQGLLAEARALAEKNVRALRGVEGPLVFCEPSCLSAIREDVPALLRGDAQRDARGIASRAVLWEEFLERHLRAGGELRLRGGPSEILLHGHCHQKSMGLLAPAKALLERVPGAKVVDLDAGCCGMAGSFGYMKANYEVSRTIAERKLLPAARAMKPEGVLVAAGMSCRHQVRDFAGVEAVHPAVLLKRLLA